ncbi:MAG TPA: hypothetical protein VJR89_09010 [Polyangiales bacterium]|nr:hypothetical protein [Polyangiales bacterium]
MFAHVQQVQVHRAIGAVRSRPYALWIASGLLAAVVTASSLSIGLIGDDFIHQQFLLEQLRTHASSSSWWNMFGAPVSVPSMIELGQLPWWSSSHLQVAFLRPLATFSHYLDYLLWPTHAAWMHAHNILLYMLVAATASHVYRALLGDVRVVWIAALLYAIDDAHVLSTAWIASRNTLLTALFCLICLACYHHGRSRRRRDAVWLAALALLLAHASSEGAFVIWPYLLSYAIFLDLGPRWQRLSALTPLALVSTAWLIITIVFDYGVRGGGAYLDPRQEPLEFLVAIPQRLPQLLFASFGLTDELSQKLPPALQTAVHALVVLLLIALTIYVARSFRHDRVVRFLAVGCLGSLLPMCAVGAVGRLLFISGWGAHALLAQLVGALLARRSARTLPRAAAGAVLAFAVVIAAHASRAAPAWWLGLHDYFRQQALALPRGEDLKGSVILTVNARDYLTTPFILLYRHLFAAPGPAIMHVLGVGTDAVRVHRPDDKSLVLVPEHGYLNDTTSILVRSPKERFALNQTVPLWAAKVHVEALTADGRPARVRVETHDLNDPRLIWVVWDDEHQRFSPFALPAVGEAVTLAAASVPRSDR